LQTAFESDTFKGITDGKPTDFSLTLAFICFDKHLKSNKCKQDL